MDGWLVGMTLCRHLKIISLSATIGPAIEKQPKLKIGLERKERICSKMPNCIWTCRQERFDRGVGASKAALAMSKYKNTEAAQRCPIVFEHAGRGGSWQRLRFRVFALELMLWKWETIHWGHWTLCMNTSEILCLEPISTRPPLHTRCWKYGMFYSGCQ